MLVLIIVFCSLFIVNFASAATVSLSPVSIAITQGQVVSVTVVVDPQGTAYTAKVALAFPPALLSVSSFSQASGWLPLSQPGYDSVDNSGGSLIKTAGATGGFSSPKTFGTVTFIANNSGVATISVTGATQVLNSSNQNTFTGGGQSNINISAPAAPIITVPTNPPAPTTNKPKTSPVRNLLQNTSVNTSVATTTAEATSNATSTVSGIELAAQASGSKTLPLNIIIPIATFLVGFAFGRGTRKTS